MAVCLQKTETMEAEEKRQKKTFIDSSEFSPFQQGRIIKMIKISFKQKRKFRLLSRFLFLFSVYELPEL